MGRATRLARSAPVRYALALTLVSVVVMGGLLAVIHGWMLTLLDRHLEESIDLQLQILRDDFDQDGRGAMLGLVRQHLGQHADSPVHVLVKDSRGRMLGGDLPAQPAVTGWQDIARAAVPELGPGEDLRGRGAWFDEDTFVLVTRDTGDQAASQRIVVLSFGVAMTVTVILVLGGGIVIGMALLSRVERVSSTARAIMDGDLSRRIPVEGAGDEFARLGDSLNRMVARMEELMENLRHVTSDIAHDLRTPLGRLRQRLESSRFRPRNPSEYEAAIDGAIEDTDSVLHTFDALLRIAQIEAGARKARFATVDVAEVARNVADAFAAVAEDQGKRVEADFAPGCAVRGDGELLTQMLANLVENALRHTSEGTTVRVSVAARAGGVQATVADDGPGIPADERDRVLRRFYRLDASRSTPGTGLGLSLVSAVAKLHDARLTLVDADPGLRVDVSFPPAGGATDPSRPG